MLLGDSPNTSFWGVTLPPIHVVCLGHVIQAKHISDRLRAGHVSKAGASSPALLQVLLECVGEELWPADERISKT